MLPQFHLAISIDFLIKWHNLHWEGQPSDSFGWSFGESRWFWCFYQRLAEKVEQLDIEVWGFSPISYWSGIIVNWSSWKHCLCFPLLPVNKMLKHYRQIYLISIFEKLQGLSDKILPNLQEPLDKYISRSWGVRKLDRRQSPHSECPNILQSVYWVFWYWPLP